MTYKTNSSFIKRKNGKPNNEIIFDQKNLPRNHSMVAQKFFTPEFMEIIFSVEDFLICQYARCNSGESFTE
jgi:hypothetical protein